MHVIKPSWLSHSGEQKDFEVYSCHISPDGKRLATAGGDGHVRVWSTESIYRSDDPTYTKPRQLCHMSHHLGTIHAVRFSPNGRYLASGADDKIICIYQLDPNPPSHAASFGTSEPPPVENWKTIKRLVGHENDVQDLAWSHDSSILVSVGLDSKVVVWSAHTFEKLKTLSVHQSHVKGVTFDPANKYFATASDDRTIKIFRFTPPPPNATQHDLLNNFVLDTTISAPFKSSPLTTYFRRCSWSPDGNHIAAPNAVNGPVSSVAIIERSRWDSEINLIGHEGPTEVCMFSPRLFYTNKPTADKQATNGSSASEAAESLVTVIASAGQDKTLSIWNTNTSRPVVILQDLASKSISDLAWAPDGQTVFASSLDGSIVVVKFEEGELGWVTQAEEIDKALQKFGASRKGMGIAEGVDGLHLENHSKAGELRGAESRMGALMGDAQQPKTAATKDSGSSQTANGVSKGATTDQGTDSSKKDAKGKDKESKDGKDDKTEGKNDEKDKDKAKDKDGDEPTAEEETEAQREKRIQTLKSRVTITKDGKKRVAPLLVSSSGTGQSLLPQSQFVGTTANANKPAQNDAPQTILDLSRPYEGLPRGGIASMLLGTKRKASAVEGDEEGGGAGGGSGSGADGLAGKRASTVGPSGTGVGGASGGSGSGGPIAILTNGVDGAEPTTLKPPRQGVVPTPEFLRPAVLSPSISVSQVRLAVPKVRSYIMRATTRGVLPSEQSDGSSGSGKTDEATRLGENMVFEARNPSGGGACHVTVTKHGSLVWQDFLPRAVLLVTGSVRKFWAAACEDGSIVVWTAAGRRLISSMVLEAQPVILESRDCWLLCITAVGMAYVWNVQTMAAPHPPVSLAPILDIAVHSLLPHGAPTSGPGVTSAHLNSNGHMVVTLTNGDGYYYAPNLYSWQRLSESWWAVGSQYWNSNDSSISALQTTGVGTQLESAAETNSAMSGQPSGASVPTVSVSSGIIPFLERHTTTEFLLKGRAYTLQRLVKALLARDGFEDFEASVSIAHLETRIAATLQLGAHEEFRLYLFMYAKRLGAEGLRGKVEELLNSLLGGVLQEPVAAEDKAKSKKAKTMSAVAKGTSSDEAASFGWFSRTGDIGGWDRRELLRGVVMILGKFRELQRLTVQYARILELTKDNEDDEDDEGAAEGNGDDDLMVVES